jgi:hypothetical protein
MILYSALQSSGLPSDYATIVVLDTSLPIMASGLSREIYVSRVFIKHLTNNIFSEQELKLFLMHEVAHKELNHPYLLIAHPTAVIGYQQPDINDILRIGYVALFAKTQYIKSPSISDYYKISQLIKGQSSMELKKTNGITDFQFAGYPYTHDMELAADEKVVRLLKTSNVSIEEYSSAIKKLMRIYEIRHPELNESVIENMKARLVSIGYLEGNL